MRDGRGQQRGMLENGKKRVLFRGKDRTRIKSV